MSVNNSPPDFSVLANLFHLVEHDESAIARMFSSAPAQEDKLTNLEEANIEIEDETEIRIPKPEIYQTFYSMAQAKIAKAGYFEMQPEMRVSLLKGLKWDSYAHLSVREAIIFDILGLFSQLHQCENIKSEGQSLLLALLSRLHYYCLSPKNSGSMNEFLENFKKILKDSAVLSEPWFAMPWKTLRFFAAAYDLTDTSIDELNKSASPSSLNPDATKTSSSSDVAHQEIKAVLNKLEFLSQCMGTILDEIMESMHRSRTTFFSPLLDNVKKHRREPASGFFVADIIKAGQDIQTVYAARRDILLKQISMIASNLKSVDEMNRSMNNVSYLLEQVKTSSKLMIRELERLSETLEPLGFELSLSLSEEEIASIDKEEEYDFNADLARRDELNLKIALLSKRWIELAKDISFKDRRNYPICKI